MAGASALAEKTTQHGGTRARAGRPKSSTRDDASAKIDRAIKGHAEMVAKHRQITLAEYLSEILRGPVNRDFLALMKKMEASES